MLFRSVKSEEAFSVVVANEFGCESQSSESVQTIVYPLPPQPDITVTGSLEFCEGNSVELQAPEYSAYEWSGGESSRSITVLEEDTISLIVIDENGCRSPSSNSLITIVNSLPATPSITPSGDLNICEGNSIELTVDEATGYLWSTGDNTQQITVNEAGAYTVQIKDENECLSPPSLPVDVFVWEIPEKPVITPSGTNEILMGDSIEFISTPANNYLWSNGDTTQSIFVKDEGKYSLVISSYGDCFSSPADSVEVIVIQKLPKPEVAITGDLMICEGESTTLTAPEAASYEWSNGEITRSVEVNTAGSYTVVITNDEGVPSLPSDPVEIIVHSNPEIEVQENDVSCYGYSDGTASVQVISGESPFNYNWSNGGTTQSIQGLEAGNYSVSVTDDNTCTTQSQISIGQPEEIVIQGEVENASCPDANDGAVSITITGGTNPYILNWNTGATGYEIQDLAPGNYSVNVNDMNNCEENAEFSLGYISELCFTVPEIITPNNDGKNDFWIIEGLEFYPDATIEVYDRWGKRVFYSDIPDIEWDGTFNGKELPMESYHYIINLNNGSKPIIGNLTIVR